MYPKPTVFLPFYLKEDYPNTKMFQFLRMFNQNFTWKKKNTSNLYESVDKPKQSKSAFNV